MTSSRDEAASLLQATGKMISSIHDHHPPHPSHESFLSSARRESEKTDVEHNTPTSEARPETSNPATRPHLRGARSSLSWHKYGHFNYEKFHSFASPSTHELVLQNQSEMETKRLYDRGRQRRRLWRLSIGEFVITVVFCTSLFGAIYGFSKYNVLTRPGKYAFNSIVTGLSVGLGINLASSLKSYAKMLKWRLLAGKYRSLSQFELLLGAQNQSNVFKLFWSEFFRKTRRHKYLPSGTQLLCIAWVLVNLAATVLVALLGLTYSLNQSQQYSQTTRGNVSILDWTACFDDPSAEAGRASAQRDGFQAYVNSAPVYSNYLVDEEWDTFEYSNDGFSAYWLIDYNPEDSRYVGFNAYCKAYDVIEGSLGTLNHLIYQDGSEKVRVSLEAVYSQPPFSGGLLFISDTSQTCGPFCTSVNVFQAQSDPNANEGPLTTVSKGQYFTCTNTATQVQNIPEYDNPTAYELSDEIARILSGAVGWTGRGVTNDTREYMIYDDVSQLVHVDWSHAKTSMSALEVSNIISGFSAAAIAQANIPDSLCRKTIYGDKPIYADYLDVTWLYAGLLLGGIPVLHFLTLLCVITWANKAVIKDDTYLAAAKLLHPLINGLGDHGCIMRGEHIIKKLNDPMVVYGWTEVDDFTKHADVFLQGSGIEIRPQFEPGVYDGGLSGIPSEGNRVKRKLKTE